MKATIPNERLDGISIDILNGAWDGGVDLTQQEIEAGLDALRDTLIDKRLPLIVLIEDSLDDAQFFRHALQKVGISVAFMHFRDGNQALNFFSGNGCYADRVKFPLPQLTVLDLKLTRLDGLEILQKIRSKPDLEKLVVVALTGSEDVHEIELAWSLKINGWVSKPQTPDQLSKIARWMLKTWLPTAL